MTQFSVTSHWFPSSVLMQGVLSTLKWTCPCYLLPVKQGYLFILPMFSKRKAHFCSPCPETERMRILWISLFPFFLPSPLKVEWLTWVKSLAGKKLNVLDSGPGRPFSQPSYLPGPCTPFCSSSWEQLLGHPWWGICSHPVKSGSFS